MVAEHAVVAVSAPSNNGHVTAASSHPTTDLGLTERLVENFGNSMRYCPPWNKWLCWDGQRHAVDDSGMAMRFAKLTARRVYHEAADAQTKERAAELAAFAKRSEARPRLEAALFLAQSEPGIPVMPHDLDTNAWVLNVDNGTIDLANGCVLREHRREDLITKLVPIGYDPAAECPTWCKFLTDVTDGDVALQRFLQRAAGYSLTGSTRERVLFILFGLGKNGKSTLLGILDALLGEYGRHTPTETLLSRRDTSIPNDLAALRGARFVSTVETEEGARLAEAKVKALTGRDRISARFMRGEWFDFEPTFKAWMATNHRPIIRGTDPAIWDRIRQIPFNVRISDDQDDKDLPDKLAAELPGILTWAIQGCLEWQRDGLGVPDAVRTATAAYRAEMDVFGAFLEDRCIEGHDQRAGASAIHKAYKDWAEANGEKPMSQRALAPRLREHGFTDKRSGTGGAVEWHGLGLNHSPLLNLTEPNSAINGDVSSRKGNNPEIGSERFSSAEGSVDENGPDRLVCAGCGKSSDERLGRVIPVNNYPLHFNCTISGVPA